MTVHVPASIEDQIKRLAQKQGRDVQVLLEEALRQYLEAAAITDVTPEQLDQLIDGLRKKQ